MNESDHFDDLTLICSDWLALLNDCSRWLLDVCQFCRSAVILAVNWTRLSGAKVLHSIRRSETEAISPFSPGPVTAFPGVCVCERRAWMRTRVDSRVNMVAFG